MTEDNLAKVRYLLSEPQSVKTVHGVAGLLLQEPKDKRSDLFTYVSLHMAQYQGEAQEAYKRYIAPLNQPENEVSDEYKLLLKAAELAREENNENWRNALDIAREQTQLIPILDSLYSHWSHASRSDWGCVAGTPEFALARSAHYRSAQEFTEDVPHLTHITELDLDYSTYDQALLAPLKNLKTLDFWDAHVLGEVSLPYLQDVRYEMVTLDETWKLPKAPLKKIFLEQKNSCKRKNPLENLGQYQGLQAIDIHVKELTFDMTQTMSKMTQLRELGLIEGSELSDQWAQLVAESVPQVKELDLRSTYVSLRGLLELLSIPNLTDCWAFMRDDQEHWTNLVLDIAKVRGITMRTLEYNGLEVHYDD